MEKKEVDPYRDYFEIMSTEREANMNRQGYKRLKADYYVKNGYDPELLDLDYAYDAGNEANKDILPAVSKKEDDSVTEDILLDTNTREGMAWAAASKALYDAYDIKEKRERLLKKFPTAGQSYRTRLYEKLKNKKEPETPQEFGQWGIEHIGWLNYHLPSFGVASMKLPYIVKKNPKSAYAFLHLLDTYGKLPMFTWNGTKRFFNGVLNDPSTYFGLGTLGIGLSGKKFATEGGKGGLKKALRAAIDPAAITMYEGALYAASDDFFRQKVAIEAGPDVKGGQESYDPVRGLTAAGGGALFGGVLYGTAKVGANVAPLAIDAVKGVINKGAESAKARIAERQSGTTLYSNPIGPIADNIMARMGGDGGGEGPPPGRNLDEFGFYSKAEEALNNIKQEKGTGIQFINQLKKKFNVKEKELYWLGLDKFANDEKVDKKTLIDTVKQNYVKIRENKYNYDTVSPSGDYADITDVEELQFQLEVDDDYSMYSHRTEDFLYEYERGQLSGYMYEEFASKLGYYTKEQVDAYEGGKNVYSAGGVFVPQTMTEKEIFDAKALDAAMGNGEMTFKDFDGEEIDIQRELNDYLDDFAREEYLQDPYQTGTDTLGLGYQIQYSPYEQEFTIYDPRGHELSNRASTLNEAQVMATTDAYDQGHLLMTDPEEAEAIAGAIDQEPGDPAVRQGNPIYANYKLDGGKNYREFVLENTSYKGDPDADKILDEVEQIIREEEAATVERSNAVDDVYHYNSLPSSEKKEFLRSKQTDFVGLINRRADTKEKAIELFLKKKAILDKYAMDKADLSSATSNSAAANRVAALRQGPRTHYGSIKNDIGHMRVTDRVSNDGEKILFIEELQSDWSQRRASMPTPENIQRGEELSRVKLDVDETEGKQQDIIYNFLKGMDPAAVNENTVNLFENAKNSFKSVFDNDERLFQDVQAYNQSETAGFPLEQKNVVSIIDDISITDLYDELNDPGSTRTEALINTLQDRATLEDPNVAARIIGDLMVEALTNVFKDKAFRKDNIINKVPSVATRFKETATAEVEKLRPLTDILINLAKAQFTDLGPQRKKLKANEKFLEARERYGVVGRGPFVQQSDDIVELQMKTLIRRAVDEGHKFVVVAGPNVHIDRWGSSYTDAFNTHYGKVVPKAAERVLKQFDKKAKVFYKRPYEISDEIGNAVGDREGEQFETPMLIIPISDEMRKSVKQGMSLFELGTLAAGGAAVAGSQMTQQENTEPGI